MAEKLTKRKLQALEMKARIQAEALRLFDEKGYEAVSIEEIAEAAGCSPGNIYHYFKGKQALTNALTHFVDNEYQALYDKYFGADEQSNALGNDASKSVAEGSSSYRASKTVAEGSSNDRASKSSTECRMSARDKFIDFAGEALKIDSEKELLFQCFIHSIKHPEQRVLRFDSEEIYPKIARRIAEELCEENEIKEGVTCDEIVHQFVIINRGILLQWRIEEGGFDIASLGRKMAENLLSGILA